MAEGVRKVNEWITQSGRTLIITDPNVDPTTVPAGTILIEPTTGKFKIKLNGGTAWVDLTLANLIMQKSITGAYIADRTVTGTHLALATVLGENIQDLEITTAKINNLAVIEGKIANSAVTTIKIADANVTTAKIADNAVITAKIADNAVTNSKIITDAVTTIKIMNSAVTEAKIADNAVTTVKIKDANVTTAKIADANVTTVKIADNAVTNAKIINDAVTATKIADGSVLTSKIADGNVTNAKIAAGAITDTKITDGSVTTAKLADRAVTNAKITDGTIAITKLDSNTQTLINNSIRVNPNNNNTATVTGNLSVQGSITATGDVSGARVFNAVYNDLAEAYIPEESGIEPGDIVEVSEIGGIKKAGNYSRAVVGVVSDCFATLFGGTPQEVTSGEKIAVGLIGRVPVKIAGRAQIGDFVVSIGNGIGVAMKTAIPGTIVGKVIQNKYSDGIDKVLCLIFPG